MIQLTRGVSRQFCAIIIKEPYDCMILCGILLVVPLFYLFY